MSDLLIIHRARQDAAPFCADAVQSLQDQSFLMWETCRRQIFFSDERFSLNFQPGATDEIYRGLDAEEFLVEVLCGLRSPLVGETEVFGQFKNWWQSLGSHDFKNKFSPRIQHIYSVVKKIREETLCGMGSQSYGSLLRKKITDGSDVEKLQEPVVIDFIGAGQLVQEIVPWIQKKWSYRIWCRQTEKIKNKEFARTAKEILPLNIGGTLARVVVVAAPLTHDELQAWLAAQPVGLLVYDFRHDSANFIPSIQLSQYLHLDHFATEVEGEKQEIQNHIELAYSRIRSWKSEENARIQVRPFGWDDL